MNLTVQEDLERSVGINGSMADREKAEPESPTQAQGGWLAALLWLWFIDLLNGSDQGTVMPFSATVLGMTQRCWRGELLVRNLWFME